MTICTTYNSPILACAANRNRDPKQGSVCVLDLEKRRLLRRFPVLYDGTGMERCTISEDGLRCYIGSYETHGLGAYSTVDGSELWRRTDLQPLQSVASFPLDNIVFCECEIMESLLLSASTGQTLDVQHGVRYIHASPFGKAAVVSARNLELHQPLGTKIATIRRKTFVELDCAFSDAEVAITESTGPVRCFELSTGKLMWTHTSDPDTHVLSLSFCQTLNCFVGISWQYVTGGPQNILRFDKRTGSILGSTQLEIGARTAFCLAGSCVFAGDGRLVSARDGKLLHQFDEDMLDGLR